VQTKSRLTSGEVQVGVGTFKAIGTGIDMPAVERVAAATPVAANRQFFNQVRGRACRSSKGKKPPRMTYFWDERVFGLKHLQNIVQWNRTVSVRHAGGWVEGREYLRARRKGEEPRHDSPAPKQESKLAVHDSEGEKRPMKKRSEVRKPAQQTTLDNAPETVTPAATGKKGGIAIFQCECGLKQGKDVIEGNDGKCLRCDKSVDTSGEPQSTVATKANGAAAPVQPAETAKPAEKDPWELTPEGQKAADAARAEKAKGRVETGGEVPLAALSTVVNELGVILSVFHLASMTPEQRRGVAVWAQAKPGTIPLPECLAEFATTTAYVEHVVPEETKKRVKKPEPELVPSHVAGTGEATPTQETTLAETRTRARAAVAAPPNEVPATAEARVVVRDVHNHASAETVRVVWGEEKYGLKGSFSMCTVGPFEATTSIRPGETRSDAMARLEAELNEHAEEARERKVASFAAKFKAMKAEITGAEAN
jgi:hypothetical protein